MPPAYVWLKRTGEMERRLKTSNFTSPNMFTLFSGPLSTN